MTEASPPTQAAIYVQGLVKTFRKRTGLLMRKVTVERALHDISFTVAQREIYGLVGPNGSGKSTLIRILSTLLVPDRGTVCILNHCLPADERWIREKIGRVSVDAAFYKKLSPRENLLYAARLYGLDPRQAEGRALTILERLGIESRRFNDPLEEMSRGMQQKIAITRALLINPPVLLLDEPTTGLDPKSKLEVQQFLATLRQEAGTTILLTTHDMSETERLCDRIGLLVKGELRTEGTAETLKAQAGAATLEAAFITLTGLPLKGEHEE